MCGVMHGRMIFIYYSSDMPAESILMILRYICFSYSDRTPAKYTMTFRKGYNTPSLKQENLIARRVVPDNYEFGKIEIKISVWQSNLCFDLERTLCDIVRGSGSDVQIVGEADEAVCRG